MCEGSGNAASPVGTSWSSFVSAIASEGIPLATFTENSPFLGGNICGTFSRSGRFVAVVQNGQYIELVDRAPSGGPRYDTVSLAIGLTAEGEDQLRGRRGAVDFVLFDMASLARLRAQLEWERAKLVMPGSATIEIGEHTLPDGSVHKLGGKRPAVSLQLSDGRLIRWPGCGEPGLTTTMFARLEELLAMIEICLGANGSGQIVIRPIAGLSEEPQE